MRIYLLILLLFCFGTVSHAQETSADFSPGSVKIGDDTRTCVAGIEGSLRYKSGDLDYCDGTVWQTCPVTGGACAITNCTNNMTAECTLEPTRSNDDLNFIDSNIASGVNILGVVGTCGGGFPSPVESGPGGDYLACVNDTELTCLLNSTRSTSDPQFIPANIKSGVNILGVVGTNPC